MKRDTRQSITDTFISMVEASSLSQVRIADLIAALNINRNTFYYHFSSKYELALWVFRCDLDKELRASLPARDLICAQLECKGATVQPYAYYVHVETGARTLDCSGFLKALARCTLNRPDFYRKLFDMHELDFGQCLANLYRPAVLDDIRFILNGRYMPDETQRMLALLGTRYILSTISFCLESTDPASLLDDRANPFWNIVHESLYNAIQAHPINRYNARG